MDAITEAEKLRSRGIELQIVNLKVDTTTPTGLLFFTIVSAFAEFERRTLSQRTREGLAAARRRGRKLGRPTKISDADLADAVVQLEQGAEPCAVASGLNVVPLTLRRALNRYAATKSRVSEGSEPIPVDTGRDA